MGTALARKLRAVKAHRHDGRDKLKWSWDSGERELKAHYEVRNAHGFTRRYSDTRLRLSSGLKHVRVMDHKLYLVCHDGHKCAAKVVRHPKPGGKQSISTYSYSTMIFVLEPKSELATVAAQLEKLAQMCEKLAAEEAAQERKKLPKSPSTGKGKGPKR